MFPQITQLPANVEIRSEERRFGQDTRTVYFVYEDGVRRGAGHHYRSHQDAERTALAQAEHAAAQDIIESTIGQERHYGIRVWSEPNGADRVPTWRVTDPHRDYEGYAFAWYSHTPPPVAVYTRAQYEAVCAALGLEAAPDSDFTDGGSYADRYAEFTLDRDGARVVIQHTLRQRRMQGVRREQAGVRASAREAVREQVGEGPYTRAQYETACAAAGLAPLQDHICLMVLEQETVRATGYGVLVADAQLPTGELETELAKRRGHGIEDAARQSAPGQPALPGGRCDNCGRSRDTLWARADSSGVRGKVCTPCNRAEDDVELSFG